MKILLHICCAPCAISPVEDLQGEGHAVAGVFYNPNIHPYSEFRRRLEAVERYASESGLEITPSDYDMESWFRNIVYKEAPKDRCPICWRLRIEKTALSAKTGKFDAFTTTLLASPYQDHAVLKAICEDSAKRIGLKFYYRDFRAGFREAHNRAKARGIYCQNYCGCVFSERERMNKPRRHCEEAATDGSGRRSNLRSGV